MKSFFTTLLFIWLLSNQARATTVCAQIWSTNRPQAIYTTSLSGQGQLNGQTILTAPLTPYIQQSNGFGTNTTLLSPIVQIQLPNYSYGILTNAGTSNSLANGTYIRDFNSNSILYTNWYFALHDSIEHTVMFPTMIWTNSANTNFQIVLESWIGAGSAFSDSRGTISDIYVFNSLTNTGATFWPNYMNPTPIGLWDKFTSDPNANDGINGSLVGTGPPILTNYVTAPLFDGTQFTPIVRDFVLDPNAQIYTVKHGLPRAPYKATWKWVCIHTDPATHWVAGDQIEFGPISIVPNLGYVDYVNDSVSEIRFANPIGPITLQLPDKSRSDLQIATVTSTTNFMLRVKILP